MIEKYLQQLFNAIAEIITIKGEYKFAAIEIIDECSKKHMGIKGFIAADSKNGMLSYEMLSNYKVFKDAIEKCIATRKQVFLNNYQSYCLTPLICQGQVAGVITVAFDSRDKIFGKQEKELLLDLSLDIVCGALLLRQQIKQLKSKNFPQIYNKILLKTLYFLSITYEKYDNFRSGHQARVASLSFAIAKKMALKASVIDQILLGAAIHDIGKLYIRSTILNRPGKLITEEYKIIKRHPEFGVQIVKKVKFVSKIPTNIILYHHERFNGFGYPNSMKGKKIPLEARIVAVADVIEAMTAFRSYHPAFSISEALNELNINKGIQFDPEVVDICMNLFVKEKFKFVNAVINIDI